MNNYDARVLLSSTPDCWGPPLVTMQVTFPRFILAEFNTHRVFSRNSASSRAIPVKKRIAAVLHEPFVPEEFTENQRGMSASRNLAGWRERAARALWRYGALNAALVARGLDTLGTHKQHANRVMEPYLWHTVLVTATEWINFLNLRTDKNAQPEMQTIARLMREQYHDVAIPNAQYLAEGEWHAPYLNTKTPTDDELLASAGRCARVSYLTQDGRLDPDADLALARRLHENGHMSPFEHQARVLYHRANGGNLAKPWDQYRKSIPHEAAWEAPC